MKIRINENSLYMLQEEVTRHSYFMNVRNFIADLLEDPINAQPSQFLKDLYGDRKSIIRKLMDKGIIKRENKIIETPRTNEEEKDDVRYSIKYSVPKEGFKDKIYQLYDNAQLNEGVFNSR